MAASPCSEHVALELIEGGFVFPLRALKEAKEPKSDHLEDNVIADPRPIPFQAELHVDGQDDQDDEVVDKSAEAVPNVLAIEGEQAEKKCFLKSNHSSWKPIPDGYHWDGTRLDVQGVETT
jgi:hypothetical protein